LKALTHEEIDALRELTDRLIIHPPFPEGNMPFTAFVPPEDPPRLLNASSLTYLKSLEVRKSSVPAIAQNILQYFINFSTFHCLGTPVQPQMNVNLKWFVFKQAVKEIKSMRSTLIKNIKFLQKLEWDEHGEALSNAKVQSVIEERVTVTKFPSEQIQIVADCHLVNFGNAQEYTAAEAPLIEHMICQLNAFERFLNTPESSNEDWTLKQNHIIQAILGSFEVTLNQRLKMLHEAIEATLKTRRDFTNPTALNCDYFDPRTGKHGIRQFYVRDFLNSNLPKLNDIGLSAFLMYEPEHNGSGCEEDNNESNEE